MFRKSLWQRLELDGFAMFAQYRGEEAGYFVKEMREGTRAEPEKLGQAQ